MAFNTGDIVKLKSGGPDMTVQGEVIGHRGTFNCQWFAGKKLERGNFNSDSLELVDQGED